MRISKRLNRKIDKIMVEGLKRTKYPEAFKGTLGKLHWNDPIYKLGMKHGYILALLREKIKWQK